MRVTKFRVRDKKNDRWVSPNVVLDYSGLLLWSFGGSHDLIENPEIYDVQFFTGLHDKNGKEIFEGDILQSHKDIMGEIVWHPTKAMFYWRYKNIWGNRDVKKGYRPKYFNKKMEYVVKNCEVIGNIYGDKDLLA